MTLKKIFIFVTCIGYLHTWKAQQSINSAGATVTGVDGQYSFSIGQVFVSYQQNAESNIQEGVQQAYTIITNNFNNIKGTETVQLFPNPTTESVNIIINKKTHDNLVFYLFDINGKLQYSGNIRNGNNYLPLKPYSSGIYMAYINQNNQRIFSQKIIKL